MRGRLTYMLVLLTALGCFAAGQAAAQWAWGRQTTDALTNGYGITTDPAGNVYCAGENWSTPAASTRFGTVVVPGGYWGQSVWAKYDKWGNALWAGGTTSGYTMISDIASDPSGNLIVFGQVADPSVQIGAFTLTNPAFGSGTYPYFLAKVDPAGTVLWAVADGDLYATGSLPVGGHIGKTGGAATDAAGNIYITGSFYGSSPTIGGYTLTNNAVGTISADHFLAKYSPAGAVLWARSFGGADDEMGLAVTVSAAGDVYVVGGSNSSSFTVGPSTITNAHTGMGLSTCAYIAKFSPGGVPLWAESGECAGGAYAIDVTSDRCGNVFMLGGFGDSSMSIGGQTITKPYPGYSGWVKMATFIAQVAPGDAFTWTKCLGSANDPVYGYSLSSPGCGQVWAVGEYNKRLVLDAGDTLAHTWPHAALFVAGYDVGGSVAAKGSLSHGNNGAIDIACDAGGNAYVSGTAQLATGSPVVYGTLAIGPDVITSSATSPQPMIIARFSNALPPPDTVYTHIDTALCPPAVLTAPAACSYAWNDGPTVPGRTITAVGHYTVAATSCYEVKIITYNIAAAVADTSYASKDTAMCPGGSLVLYGPPGHDSYLWGSGAATASVTVTGTGTYTVTSTQGCHARVTVIRVGELPLPVITLGADVRPCPGVPVLLAPVALSPGCKYEWSTGDTTRNIIVTGAGKYWLRVRDGNGCLSVDTVSVLALPPDSAGQLTDVTTDEAIDYGGSVQLNARGLLYYTWSPNDGSLNNNNINNPVATPTVTTTYKVTGYDVNGCMDTALVTIYVNTDTRECIPSAFSPNGDGLNDVFRPACEWARQLVECRIYNRWGQMVFYTTGFKQGWDGTNNGQPQELGTYFYYMLIARPDGKNMMYKGDVTLVR